MDYQNTFKLYEITLQFISLRVDNFLLFIKCFPSSKKKVRVYLKYIVKIAKITIIKKFPLTR
jgi:sporulation protein YlmC with PRC-barrel domain